MFAEIEATVAGVMAVKLALDGKVLKKWMPDSSYPTGSRDLTLKTVGEKQALAFQIPESYQETGEHVIAVMTGYFTTDRKNTVYDQVEEFALVLTGKKIED
jgi:hypothetical protein